MRSRYAAFVLGNADYLRASWHPSTRPEELALETEVRWLGLDVRRCERGGAGDGEGTVEFVARYKVNGRAGRLHEVSRFLREDGRWYYLDGVIQEGRPQRR
jgi:SEC-C motif-containing protein